MKGRGIFFSYSAFALGIVLLGVVLLWQLILSARWSQRLPPGWSWQATFVGVSTYPDPTTGQLPAQDVTAVYQRIIRTLPDQTDAMAVKVQDTYRAHDINTGQLIYEYNFQAVVDPQSGRHLTDGYGDDYFVFPRQVARQSYSLRNSYLKGIPVAYQGEELIEGLRVYLFAYQGRAEYTESYAGTADFPGTQVEPGQEIRCADDQFVYKVWVEPITGETLKVDESCFAGDYVFDIATDQALYPLSRWGGFTAGDDVIQRVEQIQQQRRRYLWTTRYLPILLWGGSILALGVGVVNLRNVRSSQ